MGKPTNTTVVNQKKQSRVINKTTAGKEPHHPGILCCTSDIKEVFFKGTPIVLQNGNTPTQLSEFALKEGFTFDRL